MDPTVAAWLSRVGIMAELLGFWFGTPGLLGRRRLVAIVNRLERLLSYVIQRQRIIVIVTGCGFAVLFGWTVDQLLDLVWPPLSPWERRASILLVALPAMLILGPVFHRRMISFLELIAQWLVDMVNDEDISQRSLVYGAALVVLGTALQVAATYQGLNGVR